MVTHLITSIRQKHHINRLQKPSKAYASIPASHEAFIKRLKTYALDAICEV